MQFNNKFTEKKLLPFLLDSYMGSFDGIAMSRWLNSIIYKLKTIPTTTMIYYSILVGYLCHLDIGKKEKKSSNGSNPRFRPKAHSSSCVSAAFAHIHFVIWNSPITAGEISTKRK